MSSTRFAAVVVLAAAALLLACWVEAGQSHPWVPATAQVMTLTEVPSPLQHGKAPPPAPATITNRAQVADIASLINGLSPIPAGARYNCPGDFGGKVTLTFRARVGGLVVAVVALPQSGCAFTEIIENGKPGPALLPGDSAREVLTRIKRITGLSWPAAQRQASGEAA